MLFSLNNISYFLGNTKILYCDKGIIIMLTFNESELNYH